MAPAASQNIRPVTKQALKKLNAYKYRDVDARITFALEKFRTGHYDVLRDAGTAVGLTSCSEQHRLRRRAREVASRASRGAEASPT